LFESYYSALIHFKSMNSDDASHWKSLGAVWGAKARDRDRLHAGTLRPLWSAMLDSLRVGAGVRVLSAGCGSGGEVDLAVKRGAVCKGIDASPQMIALAGERLPGVEFEVAGVEKVPFADASFDAIMACNVIHFAKDPQHALTELRRVTREGGRIAVASMGFPKIIDVLVVFDALLKLLPSQPLAKPFRVADPGITEQLIESAGWAVVGDMQVLTVSVYNDIAHAWEVHRSIGSIHAVVDQVGEERARAAHDRAVAPFVEQDGTVVFRNWFHYVVGLNGDPVDEVAFTVVGKRMLPKRPGPHG
jgi:SAM-dependent methyltransferase